MSENPFDQGSRSTPPKLDGEAEARLIAMRLGKPPAGRSVTRRSDRFSKKQDDQAEHRILGDPAGAGRQRSIPLRS